MKDLTLTTKEISKEIFKSGGKFNAIITKAADEKALNRSTLTPKMLEKITDWMSEVNRASSIFGKSDSQTTSSLMQLNMIGAGPYRSLYQILAQARKRRTALNENLTILARRDAEYEMLSRKIGRLEPIIRASADGDTINIMPAMKIIIGDKKLEIIDEEDVKYAKELAEIELSKIEADRVDCQDHIEGATRQLGGLKNRYKEICKNHNIPENWDEKDFEDGEIENHIRSMFRNAVRDYMATDRANHGTMEYFEQFGINPITAYELVREYVNNTRSAVDIRHGEFPDINQHYKFLDGMVDTFKDEYKIAMKRIGLDSITQADFLMRENK